MSYKNIYNKFNIANELLVNRYMLSVLLTNVFNLIDLLETKEKTLKRLLPKEEQKNIKPIKDTIDFNNFSLSNKQYQALLNNYSAEVVSNACVILDKYIQTSGKNFKHPYKKLKEWAINLAMKEKLSDYNSTICQAVTAIDYHDIDTKENARRYIQGTPFYLRNIDEGCKYLKEKFDLQ